MKVQNISTLAIPGRTARISSLGIMLAIFPGFYIYHSTAGLGFTPLFFGGWASNWNLIGAALLAPILLMQTRSHWRMHIPFATLILIVAAYALYYFRYGDEWQSQPIMFTETSKLILGWLCLYSLGWLLTTDDWSRRLVQISFSVTSIIAVTWADWDLLSFVLEYRSTAPKGVSEYSGLATAYFMISVFALSLTRSRAWQVSIIGVATLVLFLLSSRSELMAFVIIVIGWATVTAINRQFLIAAAGLVLSASILAGLLYYPQIVNAVGHLSAGLGRSGAVGQPAAAGNFRNAELFAIRSSESASIRGETIRSGIKNIKASPLLGDYGGQIRDLGEFGLYAHNVLSVWQQYGLMSFLVYLILSIASIGISLWKVLIERSDDPRWHMAAYISGACLILVLATKSVYWPVPAMAWGLVLSNYMRDRSAVVFVAGKTPPQGIPASG